MAHTVIPTEEYIFRDTTTAAKRLFWRLNGPLEGAIQVAPSQYYEPDTVMQPYIGPDGSPHAEVAHAPLLEPPVSSLTVRIRCIDEWELTWQTLHARCVEADMADECPDRRGPRPGDNSLNPHLYIVKCCEQKRPWACEAYTPLQVISEHEVLTVHEYVSAVHPWLMGLRDTLLDTLRQKDLGLGVIKDPRETDLENKLAVLSFGSGPLNIGHEDKWAWWHKRSPVGGYSYDTPRDPVAAEERARRTMEIMKARAAEMIRAREEKEAAEAAEKDKERSS